MNDDDWEIIVPFQLKAEADRQLDIWLRSERLVGRTPKVDQIRRDIGRRDDGRTVYRYAYPKTKEEDR